MKEVENSDKVKIGMLLLILLPALVTNLLMFGVEIKKYRKSLIKNEVTMHEDRFVILKKILPPQSVVGYITDQQTGNSVKEYYAVKEYYLTQYALSPIIIVNEKSRHLVIGNFHEPINNVLKDTNLILFKEFDNGVMLFKNEKVK